MPQIAPSVLDADFSKVNEWLRTLELARVDYIHWDVMDGVYVEKKTFDPSFLKDFRQKTALPFDVHLMVDKPERYVAQFSDFSSIITFHPEASNDPAALIDRIHSLGVKAGIAINNRIPAEDAFPFLEKIELVLVMSVEAGLGGQKFNGNALNKIKLLRKKINEGRKRCRIEVDGGVNDVNSKLCVNAGADILVAGSFIFRNRDILAAVKKLK